MNPWIIIAELGVAIGLHLLNKWLSDTPDTRKTELSNKPSTNEGSPIPLVFGRIRVRQPALVWYGGFRDRSDPDNSVGQGQVTGPGTPYGVNMLFVLGIGQGDLGQPTNANRLVGMWVGDKKLDLNLDGVYPTNSLRTAPYYDQTADIPNPWNHRGFITFFNGANGFNGQSISTNDPGDPNDFSDMSEIGRAIRRAYPTDVTMPQEIPGYIGQMLVTLTGDVTWLTFDENSPTGDYWDGWYMPDPSVPAISFEVFTTRLIFSSAWFTRPDADPAACIYEILTSPWGRLNLPVSKIDMTSFSNASTVLLGELNGYSRVIESSTSGTQAIQEIINQICGVLYEDPITGLYTLGLIRDDYDPADLMLFDDSHTIDVLEHTTGGWQDVVNQVRVSYTDRSLDYRTSIAIAQNTASAVMQDNQTDLGQPGGRVRAVNVNYPGVTNYTLASNIAARDLKLLSQPLDQMRVRLNRLPNSNSGTTPGDAKDLRPGMVFKFTHPDYYVDEQVFRITKVEFGQPGDNSVVITCHQDIFASDAQAFPGGYVTFIPQAAPLIDRIATEAPYWLQNLQIGQVASATNQRLMMLAHPDDGSIAYDEQTQATVFGTTPQGPFKPDVLIHPFPPSATVATAYVKTNDPYDTTTGLVVQNLYGITAAELVAPSWGTPTASDIRQFGYTLLQIGNEILAYESATDLGGGQVRLNNVWRGLLDTVPYDHVVGERVYWIGTAFNGKRNIGQGLWMRSKIVNCQMRPKLLFGAGSGGDPIDTITLKARAILPVRNVNMQIGGMMIQGALASSNIAATTGYKSATRFEEAVEIYARRRNRVMNQVDRGDDNEPSTAETVTTHIVTAEKQGGTPVAPVTLATLADAIIAQQTYLLGDAGHGTINLKITTKRTVPAGDPSGVAASTVLTAWDAPWIVMSCPVWRNLLSNPRFEYNALKPFSDTNNPGWVLVSGTHAIGNDNFSIPKTSAGYYLKAGTNAAATIAETVGVAGYLPRGMQALVEYYDKMNGTDPNDTVVVTLDPLDSGGSSLGSVATSSNVPVNTNWRRRTAIITALPANTAKLKVQCALNIIAAESFEANGRATEFRLMVGQFNYDVLTNGSFDSGNTTGWTNVTNNFVVDTITISASNISGQGGPFTDSEINQDYTLPGGYQYGATALLRLWRMQSINNDTGRVRLQVLDGSNNVLTSDDTGTENMGTLNRWEKRLLTCAIPAGAAKVRVILNAHRSGGAGNSGAYFDEIILSVHKELDPGYERVFDWTSPPTQPLPKTWQEWFLLYGKTGMTTPAVFSGGDISRPGLTNSPLTMVPNAPITATGRVLGPFGVSSRETTGYFFNRASGSSAPHLQSSGEPDDIERFAEWNSTEPFTVIALLRVDESGFASACGITGRRDSGRGWSLGIDATGHVTATLSGSLGNKTATVASTTVHDGAWHLVAMVYDPIAHELKVMDEHGVFATTSTAVGLGEFYNAAPFRLFRIGRGTDTNDTFPGCIARIYVFQEALSNTNILKHWAIGKDLTTFKTAYSRDKLAWYVQPIGFRGVDMVSAAADQLAFPIPSSPNIGSGFGLATQPATTNLIPSFDFAGASWIKDASATLVQNVVDATGKARGVTVVANTTNGLKVVGVTVGGTATGYLGFLARRENGGTDIKIELLNASDVVKETKTVTCSTSQVWELFHVDFTAWDASTGTCRIRFRSNSGSMTFSLNHVMFYHQGTRRPVLWPDANTAMAATVATYDIGTSQQANSEGELIVVGAGTVTSPPSSGAVLCLENGTNTKNARELDAITSGTTIPRLVHYDSVPASNNSDGTAITWSTAWTLNARWNSLKMLDNAANPYAGLITTGSASSTVYGRTAAWTFDATPLQQMRVGAGNAQSAGIDQIIKSVTIRTRETKLV